MITIQTEYPALAAKFQALQDGIMDTNVKTAYGPATNWDMWARGIELADMARHEGATLADIAAGLRMVADAIDPPPMVQVNRDIAEMMSRPIKRARQMEQPDA